jgi:GT2 family glycosyltransferase
MRVVAILAVHNERPYLSNCLSHLIENDIDFAVIDNGSIDGSTELLQEPNSHPTFPATEMFPSRGYLFGRKSY